MNLHAGIVEPDAIWRSRLREALTAVPAFTELSQTQDVYELLERLKDGNNMDVIFLSGQIDREEINYFIRQAKQIPGGRDAAYVLVSEKVVADLKLVAELTAGFDGILHRPFSVEALAEVTELAVRVRQQRGKARERAVIQLLVKELAVQLGELSALVKGGYQASITRRVLQELQAVLYEFSPEAREYYFESLVLYFSEIPAPKAKIYTGVSQRVRERAVKRLEYRALKGLEFARSLRKASPG